MRPDLSKISLEAKRVLSYDVNTVAKLLEENAPDIWKRCYTKSIDASDNYYSSRALANGLTGAIKEAKDAFRRKMQLDSNCAFVAGKLEECDFPLYYVTRPLVEALLHSHPPKGQTWNDITLPFPGLAFMLPRGTIQEPPEYGGNDLILLTVCKFEANSSLYIPTLGTVSARITTPYDRVCTAWFLAPGAVTIQDSTFPTDQPLEPSASWIDEATAFTKERLGADGYRHVHTGPTGEFSARIAGLIANLILVMEAHPEWIEKSRVIKKSMRADRPDVRTPTWIGKNYKVIRQDNICTDAKAHFTELGWRAGHFKRQPYGVKRAQVKTIFIEPYIAHTRGLKPIEAVNQ
jgi:hypothetical protein